MRLRHAFVSVTCAFGLFVFVSVVYVDKNYVNWVFAPYNQLARHSRQELLRIANYQRVNACILILLRNDNLHQMLKTMTQFEANFNSKYNYPYVMVNNVAFTSAFKEKVREFTNARVEFGLIDAAHWSVPEWIDREKLKISLDNLPFGINYHHMCRFYAGFFFRHQLTLKYDFYWRLDHDSSFPCPIETDPFLTLKSNDKLYGFVQTDGESMNTIATLWPTTKEWLRENAPSISVAVNNSIGFLSSDGGETLTSSCMFYNNFEISSFAIYRSASYLSYFDYLDQEGGFYYERWGDAPVRTIYITHMIDRRKVHFFSDIPYKHAWAANFRHELNERGERVCRSHLDGCNLKWNQFVNQTQ